jgi:neutral ceramidase
MIKYLKFPGAGLLLAVSIMAGICGTAVADGKAPLLVGVSKVDITPSDFTGLTNAWGKPLEKVHDPIYVRALVLSSGPATAALVSAEIGEIGDSTSVRERIEKEVGIPADSILIAATHNHSIVRVGVFGPKPGGKPGETSSVAYTDKVWAGIVEAVRQAKATLQPARFGIGAGMSDVNVNRDEYTPKGYIYGNVLDGPSDKTAWVLKFETLTGEPIAFFINHGVHSVVMGPDNHELTGELSGSTSRFIEEYYQNKVVALFTMGPAGDQNPRYQNWDPNNLKLREPDFRLMETLGRMLGEEVVRVAGNITRMNSEARVWTAYKTITCPGESIDREAEKKGVYRRFDIGPVKFRLSLLMLDNIAFAGVSTEVVTRIYYHLRKDSPFASTLLVSMVNGTLGYLTDDQSYGRTSYSARGTPAKQGCAEPGIVNGFVEMMNQY